MFYKFNKLETSTSNFQKYRLLDHEYDLNVSRLENIFSPCKTEHAK